MVFDTFHSRSFAKQDSFLFSFDVSLDSSMGACGVGFSGNDGNTFQFRLESGRVYDFEDRYVWSYEPDESINISGNVLSGAYNYFIDGNPVVLVGQTHETVYSHFFVNPEDVSAEVDMFMRGTVPNINLDVGATFLTGENITGQISNLNTNPELSFQIFSGQLLDFTSLFAVDNVFLGEISGGENGTFSLNNFLTSTGSFEIPLRLWTNFGRRDFGLPVDIRFPALLNAEFFTISEETTGVSGSTLTNTNEYQFRLFNEEDIDLTFEMFSDSGHDQFATGPFDLFGSLETGIMGFIIESGIISNLFSITGVSEEEDFFGDLVSGVLDVSLTGFTYATGEISYIFNWVISGEATGQFIGNIVASGFGDEIVSGFITESGYISGIYSLDITGYLGPNNNINISNEESLLSVFQWATGEFSIEFEELASGFATGEGFTGDGATGIISGTYDFIIEDGSGTFFVSHLTGTPEEAFFEGSPVTPVGLDFIPTFSDFNEGDRSISSDNSSPTNPVWQILDNNTGTLGQTTGDFNTAIRGAIITDEEDFVHGFDFNNIVNTIGVTDNLISFGGTFTTANGSARNRLAFFDKDTNDLIWDNFGLNGEVKEIATSGDLFFVGGLFTSFSGRNRIFAVNEDGELDPFDVTLNSWCNTVKIPDDGYVYLGGNFTEGLTRTDRSGIKDTDFNGQVNSLGSEGVLDIAFSGDRVYAVGNFSAAKYSTTSPRFIVSDLFDDSYRETLDAPNNRTNVVEQTDDGRIVIGGNFTNVGGDTAINRIAIYDTDYNILPFKHAINGNVNSMAISGDYLFVGGTFTTIDGNTRNRLASFDISDPTGSGILTDFAVSVDNNNVTTIEITDGQIYFGGTFTSVNSNSRTRLASTLVDGTLLGFNPEANNLVQSIKKYDDYLLVGGNFTNIGSTAINRLVRMSLDGVVDGSWSPNPSATVNELHSGDDGLLYAGGNFTFMSGSARQRVASFDNYVATSFGNGIGLNSSVTTIESSGDNIYLGGAFTAAFGQGFGVTPMPMGRFLCVDSSGTAPKAWSQFFASNVDDMLIDKSTGKIHVVGNFTNNGPGRNYGLCMDISGNLLPWNPRAHEPINSIGILDDNILIGGRYERIQDQTTQPYLSQVDSELGQLIELSNPISINGDVNVISEQSGLFYVGGDFTTANGHYSSSLFRVDASGTRDYSFVPRVKNGIKGITNDGTGIYIGGDFESIGGDNEFIYFNGSGNQRDTLIYQLRGGTNYPTAWTLEGSNDESSWELLSQKSNENIGNNNLQNFVVDNLDSFEYYKFRVTNANNIASNETVDIRTWKLLSDDPAPFAVFYDQTITGSGFYEEVKTGIALGEITDPTGILLAFVSATGELTGLVEDGSGVFHFEEPISFDSDEVFLDQVTGTVEATGAFYFENGTSGLSAASDRVIINEFEFIYSNSFATPTFWTNFGELVGLINSGTSGSFGGALLGLDCLASFGSNTLSLGSIQPGISGNDTTLEFQSLNDVITRSDSTLVGGTNFYPTGTPTGTFFGEFNETISNSGNYTLFVSGDFVGEGSGEGAVWQDSFTGFSSITGDSLTFVLVDDPGFTGFRAELFFGANPETGNQLGIDYRKENPYNLPGEVTIRVSGENVNEEIVFYV